MFPFSVHGVIDHHKGFLFKRKAARLHRAKTGIERISGEGTGIRQAPDIRTSHHPFAVIPPPYWSCEYTVQILPLLPAAMLRAASSDSK